MELKIYSKQGEPKLTAAPDDNGSASCGIQEESVLALSFTTFACVAVEVYDYVDFEGVRYWALERYRPRMNARKEWAYSVKFYGAESLGKQALMVNPTDGLDDPIVTLTAPAREHAALIVANLNRITGTTDWKVGEVIVTPYITIEYTGKYVSDALSELASEAETEWWFDGLTLNIGRCEFGEAIELAYGDALLDGLNIAAADGVKFFTRLFPVGSSRNIDPDRYGAARLQLPGGVKYVEQDTELGIVEHFEQEAFADIYPRRVGTVGSVRSREVKDDDGEPYTIWYFTDPDLPFDPNEYELGGLVKQVTFQSGELRGRDFEVNYDSEAHEFEIITQWPYDDDMQLPSPPLVPAAGDQYVLWNIRMPDSYYPAAEQEYLDAVNDFMAENRKDTTVITAPTDYTVVDRRRLALKPGQRVRLLSDEYFAGGYRDTRIVSVSRNVNRPGSMTLRMSDVLSTGRIARIEEQITQVGRLTRQVSSEFPDIIRSWENTPAADTNLYSARKSEQEFLNKRRGGTVEGPVSFRSDAAVAGTLRAAGAVTAGGPLTVGDYAAGLAGTGGRIDATGVAELDSLALRRFLEVPELRYNRVDVTLGDRWSAPGAGIVETVDTAARRITLKLEEGELGALRAGDICMGIYHSLTPSENAAADFDDGRGNRRFAGFATCYFRIVEVTGAQHEQLRYELRPASDRYASPVAPMTAMHFVAYGSFTDPARRTSRYETRTYQRYLKEVADWEFTAGNIAAQFGDLSNLSLFGLNMTGYSAYLDNIYMQGVLRSLDGMFRLDALRKQLLIAGESGTGIAFDPERGMIFGSVYDPETGRFVTEYDLTEIDRLQQTLAQMNDDTVFDIVEKQQMRIQWETINGAASVVEMGGSGSYYHALQIAAAAEGLSVFATADGEIFLVRTAPQSEQYAQIMLRSGEASASSLTTSYLALRDYLADMRLYDDEVTEGFDPRRLAELFTAYYDALDAVYKGLSDKAQQTADDAAKEAAAAKKRLDEWASDDVISPTEKTAMRQQETDIRAEHDTIVTQANLYEVSTNNYNQQYDLAIAAFAKYTASTPENIPVEEDYDDIRYYYTERNAILKRIDAAQKAAGDKASHRYTNPESDPPTDMKAGDTWSPVGADGNPLGYTKTYYGEKGWVITGDDTKTVIENGLVTTGTVLLGDESDPSKAKAGVTGAGTTDGSVRFWAGSEEDSMDTAPFRVTQAGKVYASDAEIAGKVDAKSGSIGGVQISENQIGIEGRVEGSGDDKRYIGGVVVTSEFIKFSNNGISASFGANVAPAVLGVPIPGIIRNEASLDDKAYGLQLDVQGAMVDNIALDIPHGAIHGVRHNVRILSNAYWAYELTDADYEAIVNDADITVRLPAAPQKGQVFRIWKHALGNATIQSLGPTIRPLGSNSSGTTYSIPYDNHNIFEVVYTGSEYLLKQYS